MHLLLDGFEHNTLPFVLTIYNLLSNLYKDK